MSHNISFLEVKPPIISAPLYSQQAASSQFHWQVSIMGSSMWASTLISAIICSVWLSWRKRWHLTRTLTALLHSGQLFSKSWQYFYIYPRNHSSLIQQHPTELRLHVAVGKWQLSQAASFRGCCFIYWRRIHGLVWRWKKIFLAKITVKWD